MINLVYPELQFSSLSLDRLSELERQGPISRLGLSVRAQNILQWRKVITIGELVEVFRSEVGVAIKRNFGPKTHVNLVHSILALSEATTPEGGVDWQKYDELVKKKFCGMRAREAVRYVGLMQTPRPGSKRNDWPRPFGKIPDSVSNQLLETLSFGNRAFYVLKSMGAVTIGDAARICPTDLLKVRNVGRNTIKEIFQTIMAAVSPLAEDPIVQDNAAFAIQRLPLVPERSEGLPEEFYLDFFTEIQAVIHQQLGREIAEILKCRLLCPEGKEWTLDMTGKKLGLTRERIRQREVDLVRMFRAAMFEAKYTYAWVKPSKGVVYSKVKFQLNKRFQETCASIPERFKIGLPPVSILAEWVNKLAKLLNVPQDAVFKYIYFWLKTLNYKAISTSKNDLSRNEILIIENNVSTKVFRQAVEQLSSFDKVVHEDAGSIIRTETISKVSKHENVDPDRDKILKEYFAMIGRKGGSVKGPTKARKLSRKHYHKVSQAVQERWRKWRNKIQEK